MKFNLNMKNLFKHISFLLVIAFAIISNAAFAQPGYNEGTQDTIIISRPTTAPSALSFSSVTSSSFNASFTAGNGTARLIVCRPSNQELTAPTDLQNYTANATFGSGSSLGFGYVVGVGNISQVSISGLNSNTNYCVDVFEYDGSASANSALYLTTSSLTSCTYTLAIAPSTGSSLGIFSNVTTGSMTFSMTPGNGQGRIIVCRPSSASAVAPSDFNIYSGDPYLSAGSQLGQGYVIASGDVNTVSFDGLIQNTNYCIDVYEYNGDLANSRAVFNTNTVYTSCQKTNMVYPFTGASAFTVTQNNPTSLSVSWTNGDGNGRIVMVSSGSPTSDAPEDASGYTASNTFGMGSMIGNAYIVYNSDGNSVTLTDLEPNTTYYFSIIEYTINGEEPAYASSLALLDSVTTIPADTDSDGVVDVDDMFPNDPNKAYATSYPASGFGSLLFEDLWPAVGDYDFNDLVIDYNYTVVANADNNAVEATFKFVTRAIGGALHNGFAFQINGLDPAKISSITGTKTTGITWTTINPNGTEVGNTSNANIPVFKDAYDLLPTTGGYWFVNVDPNAPDVGTDTTTVVITFINNGVVPEAGTAAASILSSVNFNPYIVVAQERGKEVHLANMPPSQLMNMSYFGSIDDRSVPAASNYFKSEQGLPWALNIDQSIPYTIEKTDFVNAYPNFFIWANSGGTNNTNWYTNQAGNRVTNNLIIR